MYFCYGTSARGLGGIRGWMRVQRALYFLSSEAAPQRHVKMHRAVCSRTQASALYPTVRGEGSAETWLVPHVTTSLRDFYATFMTSRAPSAILPSVQGSNAWSATPVT
jgi:hypothetical protein